MHWKKELKKGQVFLAQKELHHALKCFESAVNNCPVSSQKGLEKSLYFLGLTLKKLGKIDSALKCWHMGKGIQKNSKTLKMIESHSNQYGMLKSNHCSQYEDKEAFIGLQLQKYLNTKKNKRFCTDAEKDVIIEIILSYWSDMLKEGNFDHLSIEEKVQFFKRQLIIFPVSDLKTLENGQNDTVLVANFKSGKKQTMDDECSCGSGIPYIKCCGRILSREDI